MARSVPREAGRDENTNKAPFLLREAGRDKNTSMARSVLDLAVPQKSLPAVIS